MNRIVSAQGRLVGIIPRPNGAGADITIRLNAGDDIEIHKEKT
jgi:hypothetical protein